MTNPELPLSRHGLVVKQLENELLVYNDESKTAYCLNESSAVIWKLCDGKTTVSALSERARAALDLPIDDEFVLYALDRLRSDGLLEDGFAPVAGSALTRSQMFERLGRIGVAAAVAVPFVTAVVAPTAAKAYGRWSPGGDGGSDGDRDGGHKRRDD